MHLPLTSVATANHVRKVGESFIAVVALAAAEEDLRVFLHGYTLLPKNGRWHLHYSFNNQMLKSDTCQTHDGKTNVAFCDLDFNLKNWERRGVPDSCLSLLLLHINRLRSTAIFVLCTPWYWLRVMLPAYEPTKIILVLQRTKSPLLRVYVLVNIYSQ